MTALTWDQVGEMVEAGTEIGAHTMTHPKLSTLHGEELRQQLRRVVDDRFSRYQTCFNTRVLRAELRNQGDHAR